jgi:hypothetical protein
MKPCDQNIVTYESMLVGYTDAVSRFQAVVKGRNPITAFVALFESLNWAVALDERVGKHWVPCRESLGREWRERLGRGAEIMGGVRFARNRVHDQWSDAMVADGGSREEFVDWVWRPADDLPKGRRPDADGEVAYREYLENRPVKLCLDVLNGVFLTLQFLLEPHTARTAPQYDLIDERDP